jgi:hypothetical protein
VEIAWFIIILRSVFKQLIALEKGSVREIVMFSAALFKAAADGSQWDVSTPHAGRLEERNKRQVSLLRHSSGVSPSRTAETAVMNGVRPGNGPANAHLTTQRTILRSSSNLRSDPSAFDLRLFPFPHAG